MNKDCEIISRSLTIEDIPEIKRLCDRCLPITYSVEFFNNLFEKKSHSRFRGIFHQGKLVALIACEFSVKSKQSLSKLNLAKNTVTCYIGILCVEKIFRRFGFATSLMNTMENFCRTQTYAKYIYLHVSAINEVALKFYHKLNYKIIDKNETYYNGILETPDAYIMVLELV